MQALLMQTLAQPQVQSVVAEFLTLRADPAVVLDGPEGEVAVRCALEGLFDVLMDLLQDQQILAQAGEFSEDAKQHADRMLAGLERGRMFCVGAALPEAVVALYLLRRRLRSLGDRARDEEAVVTALDGVVALLAPGVSVLELWQDNRSSCTRLWVSLSQLISSMDAHCPDPAVATAAPQPSPLVGSPDPA